MANFESFNRRMLSLKDEPHVTISKRGTISINRSSYEILSAPAAVELLFDRRRQIIGLRAVDQRHENAYLLRRTGSSQSGPWTVSAMAFTRFYEIDTSVSVRHKAYLEDDVLCVDISMPGDPVSGRATRRAPDQATSGRDPGLRSRNTGTVTCELLAVCIDAHDPLRVMRFWAGLLGWTQAGDDLTLRSDDGTGFPLRFVPSEEPKRGQNQAHVDLTSHSLEDQRATVTRALDLGARHIDVGQRPEEGHVVLADPEGNEFCVIEPGNQFLADCGFVGALACDGSQEVGYFWSTVLNWPLVWDQDQETAIRSPTGGPKITWSGQPVAPKRGSNRLHFDLAPAAPPADDPLQAEVDRMVALGARLISSSDHRVTMVDPDGNAFCLRPNADATAFRTR